MLLSACCASQNGPAPDAGKAAVRQTQKPQTGSLFSDDEDIQVKLSDPTGDRWYHFNYITYHMSLSSIGISSHPEEPV